MKTIGSSEKLGCLQITRLYDPDYRTLHAIILFIHPKIYRMINFDLNPGERMLSELSLPADPSCSGTFVLISLIYLFVGVLEGTDVPI
jgi:hypothetical protein